MNAPPMNVWSGETSDALGAGTTGQVVVVHGMVSPDRQLVEAEVLASTNPSLDEAAIEHAQKAHALQIGLRAQPGTTPQSREIIFTVQFAPRPVRPALDAPAVLR